LAEDSASTRVLVKKMLRNLGYEDVELAEHGLEALKMLEAADEEFDLLISDWIMPEMNGLDLVKAIREREALKHLPVLLVTADEDPENIMAALRAGADNYMCKPYDAKVLAEKINKIFAFRKKRGLE